ncbi:MAG: FecR domain-containing protein [Bacteroidales bacterium]|nr:FecR domain-containing protein [Bacteroidales bacterium]
MDIEKLLRYIRGNDSDKAEIEKWADSDPENVKELLDTAKTDYALRFQGHEGDYDADQAWRKVMRKQSLRRVKPLIRVAAAVAVFVLGGAIGRFLIKPAPATETIAIASGASKKAEITLPDGTLAYLNSNTKISFPSSFKEQGRREVRLSGEACFRVAPSKVGDFVVLTNKDVIVTDLGTVFNVQSFDRDSVVQVALIEGSVRTDIMKDGFVNDTHLLKSGDHLTYNCNSGELSMVNRGEGSGAEWMQNRLVFTDTPLNEVARQLGHLLDKEVKLGPGLDRVRFSGTFDDRDEKTILSYISEACGVHASVSDNRVLLIRK